MARRGRPQSAGERYASGDLRPAADRGTDEHRQKRIDLVGPARDNRTAQRIAQHEALASSPLGVLYARRLILSGDRYTGLRYLALFTRAVRPLTIPTVLGNLIAAGSMTLATMLLADGADEEAGAQARADYLGARAAIERLGAHVAQAVDNVCVYEHPPRGEKQLEALRSGLDALHRHFEAADERARAAAKAA